jgi:glycine/D-amino acid oxidase-like deaminating enzyme
MAYFLMREGMRNVLVLERSAVAAGASGRASGLVGFFATNHPTQAALLKASADLYAAWEQEIGGPSAITRVGGLLPAGEADLHALEREVAIMRDAGHDTRLVDRAEIAALTPGWNLDGIVAAAYSPGSGYIDPPMVTTALMNRARALGARVYQGAEVTAIRSQGGRVVGVDSNRGAIDAPVVVIAAGAWSARVGHLVGAKLDVWPVRHQVLHLKPPAGLPYPFPVCGDAQNSVYFRPEHGGLVLAANSGPDNYPDEPPGDAENFDPTVAPWYGRWIMNHLVKRVPAMAEAEIVGGHAGVYPKGSDNFPLLGALREAEGLYCLCDTAGNGMTSSPGLARALAETIVRGRTFVDITPFRPSRFAENGPVTTPYRHAVSGPPASWDL